MNERYIQKILQLFPKLYYFVPSTQSLDIQTGHGKIRLTDAASAVLWLLETLTIDQEDGDCFQWKVEELICWWNPQINFSRTLRNLLEANCIIQMSYKNDRRRKLLKLTSIGKEVLAKIKFEREAVISLIFEGLKDKEQEQLIKMLEQCAQSAWTQMRR